MSLYSLKDLAGFHFSKLKGNADQAEDYQRQLAAVAGLSVPTVEAFYGQHEYALLKTLEVPFTDQEKKVLIYAMAQRLSTLLVPFVLATSPEHDKFMLTSKLLINQVIAPALEVIGCTVMTYETYHRGVKLWLIWAIVFTLVEAGWYAKEQPEILREILVDGVQETHFEPGDIDYLVISINTGDL